MFSWPLILRRHLNCGMKGIVALYHHLLLGRLWIYLDEELHIIALSLCSFSGAMKASGPIRG